MSIGLLVLSAALVSPAPTPASPGQKGSARPAPYGTEVVWAKTWDEAVAKARKMPDGRILVEFVDSRCGECSRMESLIIPSASFYGFARDKVPVRLDRETPEGKKLAERFQIPAVPAWVIVTPDMVVSGVQAGPTSQGGWFETFVKSEQGWTAYQKKLAQEQLTPGNEELVFDVAHETFRRGGDALAEPRFRRLTKSTKPLVREQSLAYLASIELDGGRIEEATHDLDELLSTGTDPTLKERAEFRRAEVEIARGRKDAAATRLVVFKKLYPKSPLVKDADELLQALKARGVPVEN